MKLLRLTPTCGSHQIFRMGSMNSLARLSGSGLVETWFHDDNWDLDFGFSHPVHRMEDPSVADRNVTVFRGFNRGPFIRSDWGIASEIIFWKMASDTNFYALRGPDCWVCIMDADTYFGSGEIFNRLNQCEADILGTGIDDTIKPLHLSGGAVFIRGPKFFEISQFAYGWLMTHGANFRALEEVHGVPFARDAVLGYFAAECMATRVLLPHDEWYTGHTYSHLEQFVRAGGYVPGSLFYHVHVGERRDKGKTLIQDLNYRGWAKEP